MEVCVEIDQPGQSLKNHLVKNHPMRYALVATAWKQKGKAQPPDIRLVDSSNFGLRKK